MRAVCPLAPALVLLAAGCGGSSAVPIERTVGGERRLGTFVSPYSYEHFVRGELARERGQWAEAAEHYEFARAGAEDDPLLAARLADVRDRLGDRAAAERALDEGERLDADAEIVWMTRGEIAERHGELEAAIAAYARAAQAAGAGDGPVLALARVLRAIGNAERADAVLEEYIARAGDPAGAARARLSLALARSDARAAGLAALDLARASSFHAREVAAAARALLDAGHPTLARRMIAVLPDDAVPRLLRLRVALAAGARDEAEALLLRWRPDDPGELIEAAQAWIEIGEPAYASELAEVALARGGGSEARLLLARAWLGQGRIGDAVALAASIPPGDSRRDPARALIAEALERAGLPALAAEVRASGR